jgi:cation:H+ antiporter
MLWFYFMICSGVVVFSGIRLSRYGDVIAQKSGLGRLWIGVVLMASVTSLPELVTGISSVVLEHAPDIAVGDVVGSCVFNLLILAILDGMLGEKSLSARASKGHVLSASFGILLLSVAAVGMLLRTIIIPVGWIGPYTFFFFFAYIIAMRLIHGYEQREVREHASQAEESVNPYGNLSLKAAVGRYALHAVVVVIAAVFLPGIGVGIAAETGLGQTFVGTYLIALATSLPELVVSISAARAGAIDLAVGNVLGSNLFNMMILGIDDLFFVQGPLLSFASMNHVVTLCTAIAMSAVAMIGIVYRSQRKTLFLAWDAFGILFFYGVGLFVQYQLRSTGAL